MDAIEDSDIKVAWDLQWNTGPGYLQHCENQIKGRLSGGNGQLFLR